jgi:hypothetical protein
MIDERRLDELETNERDAMAKRRDGAQVLTFETVLELIRLARLGLWAEKHGVPALEKMKGWTLGWHHSIQVGHSVPREWDELSTPAKDALATLPRAEK